MLHSQLPGTNRMHSGGWPGKNISFCGGVRFPKADLPQVLLLGIVPQFGVILKGFVGHNRTQIGAADGNVDHLANALAGVSVLFTTSDAVREIRHPIEHGMHFVHDVVAIDYDGGISRRTQCNVERSPSSNLFASGSESRSYGSISMGERYQHSLRSDWQMTDACARGGEDGICNRR